MPPEKATSEILINNFESKFARLQQAVDWVKEHPQNWTRRVAEFDATLQMMNKMLSGEIETQDSYHDHVATLKAKLGLAQLPTLASLAHLQPDFKLKSDNGFLDFSCQLIRTAMDNISQEMKPGGDWEWVTEIKDENQALTGLLGEGYGYLLAQSGDDPELQRAFILAFEEVLWTEGQDTLLLNDYIGWMYEERNDFAQKVAEEIGGERRYQRIWGDRKAFGDDSAWINETLARKVVSAAWSQACPNVPDVVKTFGLEWTLQRYVDCNFWGQFIIDRANQLNSALAEQLDASIERTEPVGKHHRPSTPDSHQTKMSKSSTVEGYALPRVLIEQLGRVSITSGKKNRTWERVEKGLELLDQAILASDTPEGFLARLAGMVTRQDGDAHGITVLGHVFAKEMEEEGGVAKIKKVAEKMKKYSPRLWQLYLELTPTQRDIAGMISTPLV